METGLILSREYAPYVGPILELKKGSDSAKQAAGNANTASTGANTTGSTAQKLATTNQGIQTSARDQAQPFASSLLATKPGALSPYAAAQYAAAQRNNAQTASNQRALGNKAAALRGFNNSPGSSSSVINTANREQGAADTSAYNNALQSTLGQGLAGLQYSQGQQSLYDPNKALQTATGAYGAGASGANAESNAANVMNQSPTLLGDIGGGLMGLAGAAGSLGTGLGNLGWKPLSSSSNG